MNVSIDHEFPLDRSAICSTIGLLAGRRCCCGNSSRSIVRRFTVQHGGRAAVLAGLPRGSIAYRMHAAVLGQGQFARVRADTRARAIQGVCTAVLQVGQKVSVILGVVIHVVFVGPVGPQESISDGGLVVRLSRGFEGARMGSRGRGSLVRDVVGEGWHVEVSGNGGDVSSAWTGNPK